MSKEKQGAQKSLVAYYRNTKGMTGYIVCRGSGDWVSLIEDLRVELGDDSIIIGIDKLDGV
jgi:hypothetical protein